MFQSCEKEVNELVSDSVSKILNLLQQLCVDCGKIAATLDICPRTLSDQKKSSLQQIILQRGARLDDLLNAQVLLKCISQCQLLMQCNTLTVVVSIPVT